MIDKKGLELFRDKLIRVVTTSNLFYTGYIKDLPDGGIILIDKTNSLVLIPYEQVERVIEWGRIQ